MNKGFRMQLRNPLFVTKVIAEKARFEPVRRAVASRLEQIDRLFAETGVPFGKQRFPGAYADAACAGLQHGQGLVEAADAA